MRNKVTAILDHLCEILEGDVSARRRIVETAVGILFDDHRFRVACHIAVRDAHVRGFSPRGWSPLGHNTANQRQRRIKDAPAACRSLPSPTSGYILRALTAAHHLACPPFP